MKKLTPVIFVRVPRGTVVGCAEMFRNGELSVSAGPAVYSVSH